MRVRSFCWTCSMIILTSKVISQSPSSVATPLLSLIEVKVSISSTPPVESGTCTVVNANGDIYLEKRSHLLKDQKADLKVYEGHLTSTQRDTLSSLLENDELRKLTAESARRMPMAERDFGWVTAKIKRASSVQQADYRHWRNSSNEEYDEVDQRYIAVQRNALRVLTPLLNWAKAIDPSKLKPAAFKEEMCSR
jgi:hypothetical protein